MSRKAAIAIVSAVVAMLSMIPSHAADVVYVSGPAEQFRGFTFPVFAIQAGTPVDYLNADINAHQITADRYGPDKPWCELARITPGQCPLFGSAVASLGQRGPIFEIQSLPAGTYTFRCPFHPAQKGTLVVV